MEKKLCNQCVLLFPVFKKQSLLVIGFIALLICFAYSCKDNPTDSAKRIKHPRDMTWTCDTIKPLLDAGQLYPKNLLVLNLDDVWLVCHSDIARGLIWHYDGKTWTESNIYKDVGGMRVNDIAKGSNARDMWAAGYSGSETFIGYYDGVKWNRYAKT